MNLIYLAALIAACSAAKLDRTYLPPPSAASAGGSPDSLQAPLTRTFEQSQNVPAGGFLNEKEGVVVDAAIAGTRASSQQSGMGGTRDSYGFIDSKVGDAAFRATSQNQQNTANDGANEDDLNPDLSAFYQPSPAFKPGNVQIIRDYVSSTIKSHNDVDLDGFNYGFETDNGIKASGNGVAGDGVKTQGGYSYTGDDGKVYSISYIADENGFRAQGSHLPTPPPIPLEILKSLEQNARDEAAGIIDDGSYDPKKYNNDDDYAQYEANAYYNERLSNKLNRRPGSGSGASINQNQPTFVRPNIDKQFGFASQLSKDGSVTQDPSEFRPSGLETVNNKNNLQKNEQSNKFFNNVFASRNEYLPPKRDQQDNVLPAGDSVNKFPEREMTQQSSFNKPQSDGFNSQGVRNPQIGAQTLNSQNTQGAINGFGFANINSPFYSSQRNDWPSQDSDVNLPFNSNPSINQQSILPSNNAPPPQNSFSQSFASTASFLSQSSQSQPSVSTNIPFQLNQRFDGRLPTSQFSPDLSGSLNPGQLNFTRNQYTQKPTSNFPTSFFSVNPTRQPQITLTTPLETTKINEYSTAFDAGKQEPSVTSAQDSTILNSQVQNIQNKETLPTDSTSTFTGNSFSGFSTPVFNQNFQTTLNNFGGKQAIPIQNNEPLPTDSLSTFGSISGFSTQSFNTFPETVIQHFDNKRITSFQNEETLPNDSTRINDGNKFAGFSSFNTNSQTTQNQNQDQFSTDLTSTFDSKLSGFSTPVSISPQTTSKIFDGIQTTQIQNKEKFPTESTSLFDSNTFSSLNTPSFNTQTTDQIFDSKKTTQLENKENLPTDLASTSSDNKYSGFSTSSYNTNPQTQTTFQSFDNTQSTQLLQNNKPRVTSAIFSPISSGNSYFASNNQKPTYNFQSNQFIAQPQEVDHSYIYNRPSIPFHTPFVLHQTNKIPSKPISDQFNRVTQSMTTPQESTVSTQYQSQTSFTKENDYNKNTFPPTTGITQASISPFPSIAPTVSSNFKDDSNQFHLKPSQQKNSTPSFLAFPHAASNSATATAEITSTVSDNTQSFESEATPNDGTQNTSNQQYSSEIYEYNKPTQGLPSETKTEGFDFRYKTDKPQITSTQYGQEELTTKSVEQLDVKKPLFGNQPSVSISQHSGIDSFNKAQTMSLSQGSFNTNGITFSSFNQPGSGSFTNKPSKFFPSTLPSNTLSTQMPTDSQTSVSFSTTLSQSPISRLQSDNRFGSSVTKELTTLDFPQTETQADKKPSTLIPSSFQTNTDSEGQTQYTHLSQSFSTNLPTNVPQFEKQSSQFGLFGNKVTTTPQFQQTVTQFNKPTTLQESQFNGFNSQNADFDVSTSFLQSTNQPIQFGVQSNTQGSEDIFGTKGTTRPEFQSSKQKTTTFNEPPTSFTGSTQTDSPLGTTQFGEIYDYTKPAQGLPTPSENMNNAHSQVKPQFDKQLNQEVNKKDETGSSFTQSGFEGIVDYNTGSNILQSTPQDQTTFNTKESEQAPTTGEIYDYTKPTQGLSTPQKENSQFNQFEPFFTSQINTPLGPQIIPIFQRNMIIQSGQQFQKEDTTTTSQFIQTGSTPQTFNTEVTGQISTSGEIYEYTKPEQRLPSEPQKVNSQLDGKDKNNQIGTEDEQKYELNLTTTQTTQAPTTTFGVTQGNQNSQNTNILAKESVSNEVSGQEDKPLSVRPHFAFHSACCKGFKAAPTKVDQINKLNPNIGTNIFEQNKTDGQFKEENNKKDTKAPSFALTQEFNPQRGSQTYAGIGEKFGGPRKPPSFDETGYHY